jgi:hypothetical protein
MLILPTRRAMIARLAPVILLRRYQFLQHLQRVSRAVKESQDINYQRKRIDTGRNESILFMCSPLFYSYDNAPRDIRSTDAA